MGSVNSSSDGDLYRAASTPIASTALAFNQWFKVGTYTAGRSLLCWSFAIDALAWRIAIGNGTVGATGAIIQVFQQNGATEFFYTTVSTGSFTGWINIGGSHANGASEFEASWRLEGATSMTTALVTGCSDWPVVNFAPWDVNKIFDDETSAPAPNVSSCSAKVWTTTKSASDQLSESASLNSMVSSANAFAFLRMSSAASAGTDTSGAGHNYTTEGTLVDDSSEPNAALTSAPPALFLGNPSLLF